MASPTQAESSGMKKSLGLFDFFSIGFGAIIGTGWLLLVGDWMVLGGGPVPALIAFAIGAVALLPMGAVFGELTAAIPVSGGTVEYIHRAFGYNASYITSWFLALGNAIICPWESIAIGALAGEFLPALKTMPLYSVGDQPVYLPTLLIAVAFSAYVWYTNHKGVEQAASLQKWMTRILLMGMFTAIGIAVFKGSPSNLAPIVQTSDSVKSLWGGVLPVLVMTPFFYAGFDTIPQQAEEAAEGLDWKKFGGIISLALLSSGVFYMVAIYAFGSLTPWQQFITYPIPALTVLDQVMGLTFFAKFLLFAAICGIVSTLNSFFGATTRIMLAMARKGQIPGAFAHLHPEAKTPVYGNLFMGVLTLAGPFFGKKLLVPLTNVSSLAFIFACLMVSLAAFKLRKTEPNLHRPYNVPGGLVGIGAAILVGLAIVGLLVLPFSPAALKPMEWAIVGAWVGLGVLLAALQRSSGKGNVTRIDQQKVS